MRDGQGDRQGLDGPLSALAWEVRKIGWKWISPLFFFRPGQTPLPVAAGTNARWAYEAREGLRLRELQKLVKRQPHLWVARKASSGR